MTAVEKTLLEHIVSCFRYEIDSLPKNKNELLEAVEDMEDFSVSFGNDRWTRKRLGKEIKAMPVKKFNTLKSMLGQMLKECEEEEVLAAVLCEAIEERFPDENMEVLEFDHVDNYFNLTVGVCANVHHFEVTGDICDLIEAVSHTIKECLADIETCPICRTTDAIHHFLERKYCMCGAPVYNVDSDDEDDVKSHGEFVLVRKVDKQRQIWFRRPAHGWTGGLPERRHVYANYLRERQFGMKYDKSDLSGPTDEELIDSFRFCQGCGKEMFSKEDENRALLEALSPEGAMDMIDALVESHEDGLEDD